MRKQGSLRGIILLVISFSVINYVVSKSVRLRQADTLFLYPLGRFAPVLYIRLLCFKILKHSFVSRMRDLILRRGIIHQVKHVIVHTNSQVRFKYLKHRRTAK